MAAMEHFHYINPPYLILKLLDEKSLTELEIEIQKAKSLTNDAMNFDRITKTQLSLSHTKLLLYMLHHYSEALQLQETGKYREAMDKVQQLALQEKEKNKKLISMLDDTKIIGNINIVFLLFFVLENNEKDDDNNKIIEKEDVDSDVDLFSGKL